MKTLIKPHQYWLFYFCKAEVRVYRMMGTLRLIQCWQREVPEHFSNFQTFALNLANTPVLVLIESEDHRIHTEKIPFILGWDRLSLIDRKLTALGAADKTLANFISQGRSQNAEGQKEEKLQLIALTDSADHLPWLLVLRQAHTRIAAVTTTALVTASTARETGNTDRISLHASWNRGGLVQTLLDKGIPTLVRFCPWASDIWSAEKGWNIPLGVETTTTQTKKLLIYLQDRGLWSSTLRTPLTITLPSSIGHDKTIDWQEILGISWHTVIAPETILPDNHTTSVWLGGESLALTQMASLPNVFQLAPRSLRIHFLHWRLLRLVWRVVTVMVLLLMLASTYYGGQWLYSAWQNKETANLTTDIEAQYQKKQAAFPKIGISNHDLRNTVSLAQANKQCYQAPPDLLLALSRIMQNHPQIELTKIRWNIDLVRTDSRYADSLDLICIQDYQLDGVINSTATQSQRDIQMRFEHWVAEIVALTANKIKVQIKTPPLNLAEGKYREDEPAPTKALFVITFQWKDAVVTQP